MKVRFNVPMFHQGTNYEKGKVYDLEEAQLAALDPNDYTAMDDDEPAEAPKAKKSKGAPKDAENK